MLAAKTILYMEPQHLVKEMTIEVHHQEVINNLKSIITSTQSVLDAFYADQLEYKNAEDSMNYIRLCSQRVQLHMKNCLDSSCKYNTPELD